MLPFDSSHGTELQCYAGTEEPNGSLRALVDAGSGLSFPYRPKINRSS